MGSSTVQRVSLALNVAALPFPEPLPVGTSSDTCFWAPRANKSSGLTARTFYKKRPGFKVVGSQLQLPDVGMRQSPGMCPEQLHGDQGRLGAWAGSDVTLQSQGWGDSGCYCLPSPPAPLLLPTPALGSPSKVAKGLQAGVGEGK